MKSNIRLVSTKEMSRDKWLQYRVQGLGASEVSCVMGLNSYKSSIQLFYEKIGEALPYNVENISAFLGKEQEDFLATLWEFWDGSQESMMENYRNNKVIRRCKKINAYAHNDKYPWLFVSLDREINKYDSRGNGALELKTIGGMEASKWAAGFPPGYVTQLQTQCMVCEYVFGEAAVLRDNREYYVLPFDENKSIQEAIEGQTKAFWDKVVEARKVVTKRFNAQQSFNYAAVEELNAELMTLEPPADGSDAYNAFLKEKYRIAIPGERRGSIEELNDAQKHKALSDQIKALEEEKQLFENRLKNSIRDGCDKLDFLQNGFVSWKTTSKGSRMFLNKVKS